MSQNLSTDKSQTTKQKLINISFIGMARAALGLPIQHPFETIKTWMQSQNQKPVNAMKNIYQNKGIKGFYAGFGVNCVRTISKSAYRWPLTIYLISLFRQVGKDKNWSLGTVGVAAGLVTALMETVIICPMERLKVWLMTSKSNLGYKNYLQLKTLWGLFDGFQPVLLKQVLSWVSFLGSQQYFKQLVYRYYDQNPKTQELTNFQLMFISFLVCVVNTIIIMPADYIKTHYQKFNQTEVNKLSLREFIYRNYLRIGIAGFYRGGFIKIIHYNINAMLTVPLMEKLLRNYSQ